LVPQEFFRILLFKDSFNYAGIKESDPSRVHNRWDIVLHLPEVTRKKFTLIVAKFVQQVEKYNQKLAKSLKPN